MHRYAAGAVVTLAGGPGDGTFTTSISGLAVRPISGGGSGDTAVVYVADPGARCVKAVAYPSGAVTTLAGVCVGADSNGQAPPASDGVGANAAFVGPTAVWYDDPGEGSGYQGPELLFVIDRPASVNGEAVEGTLRVVALEACSNCSCPANSGGATGTCTDGMQVEQVATVMNLTGCKNPHAVMTELGSAAGGAAAEVSCGSSAGSRRGTIKITPKRRVSHDAAPVLSGGDPAAHVEAPLTAPRGVTRSADGAAVFYADADAHVAYVKTVTTEVGLYKLNSAYP